MDSIMLTLLARSAAAIPAVEEKKESKPVNSKFVTPEFCAFFNKTKHIEYDFLSNFYLHPVVSPFLGTFQCSEGMYQYQKFHYLNDPALKKRFLEANGQQAYDLSRELTSKTDPKWDKVQAMQETLRCKFADKDLKAQLLATNSAYLVENSPVGHDAFWADNGNGKGQNKLGTVLMTLREELGGIGVVPRPATLDLFYGSQCDLCTNCCHFTNKGVIYNYCDSHMTHELKLGDFSMPIHLSDIPDGTGRFLYFKTNEIDGLVKEGTRLFAERIRSLGLKNPFFITPEASTIAIAHDLRTQYGIDGLIIGKSKKPTDIEIVSIDYCAITSTDKKTLYLDKLQAAALKDKDIVILDNVCTTGETIRAVYQLMVKAGVRCDKIAEAMVLFTEGIDATAVAISDDVKLKLHRFTHLPLFPTDPSVDKTRYRLYSAATFPTEHGVNTFAVFQDKTASDDKNAIAFYTPSIMDGKKEDIVVRVHDACMTSEVFDSQKCDCKLQLDYAKKYISENGGLIIYLNQEGRGIGLGNKIAAYNLQQTKGLDTVMANRALGLPDDMRHYEAVSDILKTLGIQSIKLMTNNPRKIECLKKLGITVNGTVPCIVEPRSEPMRFYMWTKDTKMGHTLFHKSEDKIAELDKPILSAQTCRVD